MEGENGKLPLNSIAKAIPKWQPAKIERRDMNRTIEVRSEVEDGVSGNGVVLGVMNSDRMKKSKPICQPDTKSRSVDRTKRAKSRPRKC